MNNNGNIKHVEVKVQFGNGNFVTNLVPVDKSSYASLQSKACTYKNSLIANVFSGKISQEEAVSNWHKNVVKPWHSMIDAPLRASYPSEVADLIDNISPNSEMLKLSGLPETMVASSTEVAEVE